MDKIIVFFEKNINRIPFYVPNTVLCAGTIKISKACFLTSYTEVLAQGFPHSKNLIMLTISRKIILNSPKEVYLVEKFY